MMHHQITTFLMVAEQGSLKGAAEALFLSPAAVMKQMWPPISPYQVFWQGHVLFHLGLSCPRAISV